MSKSWHETNTLFAKKILLFINHETHGDVAWFKNETPDKWTTSVQLNGTFCVNLEATSETELAKKYWEFYFKRVQLSAKRYSRIWHLIFSRNKHRKSQERLKRWTDWRNVNFPQ